MIIGQEDRVETFRDDGQGYRAWLGENPNGYVLNVGTHCRAMLSHSLVR